MSCQGVGWSKMNQVQPDIDKASTKKSWPRILIRIAMWMTYPFLVLSVATPLGLGFASAFISEISIENRTREWILVTPVGTVGKQGIRSPLPIVTNAYWPTPAAKRGGFKISPDETITFLYDMDDINFSELVVQNSEGQERQIVVNSNPTQRQYHAPEEKHYVIDDFEKLAEVPVSVRDAATAAQVPTNSARIMFTLIILPWFVYFGLSWLDRKFQSTERNADDPSPG